MRRRALAGAFLAVAAFAGCGDSDEPLPPQEPTQPEKTDKPARLPEGWHRLVNRRAGFSVGLPPGWKARGARGATLVRSGDKLMAVSITADRSPDGRVLKPTAYAERLAQALPGYTKLKTGRPVPVTRAHYPGGSVTATGTFRRTHVRQAIRVVALQRRGQVTYALVFFRTEKSPAALYRPATAGMIRSFRGRAPVGS
jgi:hypothetical protein